MRLRNRARIECRFQYTTRTPHCRSRSSRDCVESIDKIAFSKKNFKLLVPDWTHKEPDGLGNAPDEESAKRGQRHGSPPDVTVSLLTCMAQRKLKDRDNSSSDWVCRLVS